MLFCYLQTSTTLNIQYMDHFKNLKTKYKKPFRHTCNMRIYIQKCCPPCNTVFLSIDSKHWQGWEFALSLFALDTLYLKRVIRAKWADGSFHFFEHKSDLLFMKEQFALFRSGLCFFLKKILKTGLKIYMKQFYFAFIKKPKKVTRANCSRCSFKKSD